MARIIHEWPTVENTELLATYSRTSPQLYSSIATCDKYLLRYASSTWNIQFLNCQYHSRSMRIRLDLPLETPYGVEYLYIPKSLLSQINFQYHQTDNDTFILETTCEIYLLAENIIIKLPTVSSLSTLYPQLISNNDGLCFSIPYLDIETHNKIIDNLTKLSILDNLVIYPLQRFPPQPLSTGIFQGYSNLTPLQSLYLANESISKGSELSKNIIKYLNTIKNTNITTTTSPSPPMSRRLSSTPDTEIIMLSQNGYGDDDEYNLKLDLDTMGNSGAMDVEIVGGFNSIGIKRTRRESGEEVDSSLKQKRG